jgi:leucyl aminopeptidase
MIKIINLSELDTGSKLTSILVSEDIKEFSGDKKYFAIEKKARDLDEFKGENDKAIVFYSPENLDADKLITVGVGKKDDLTLESLRRAGSNLVKKAVSLKAETIDIIFPDVSKTKLDENSAVKAILEGAYLSNYYFNNYKSKKEDVSLKKIRLVVKNDKSDDLADVLKETKALCKSVFFARDLVTTPSSDKRPSKLKELIVNEAEKAGIITRVLGNKELEEKGFHSHLGVAKGSSEDAYLVILEYTPDEYDETIALVGKGITFDSGGLDIKPAAGMEDMKLDMGGAAAVSGAALALAKSGVKKRIITVIPIAENMPSGDAYRPGDVLKSYSGKTIEVLNTDAEGRLILADALTYTEKLYKPDLIIDAATLTGACMVALGDKIAGVFSKDDETAQAMVKTGKEINEPCWQLPVFPDYAKLIKSSIADMKNIGGRYGGAITAAIFLNEFVEKSTYVHLDIAGPAFSKKAEYYTNIGGTGYGVRLISEYIKSR